MDSQKPEPTVPKQNHLYAPGQSGNPSGRPRGTRNKVTELAQALLDGQAEALVQKAIALALSGDKHALRLCIERILPPCKTMVEVDVRRDEDVHDTSDLIARLQAAQTAYLNNPSAQPQAIAVEATTIDEPATDA